MRTAAPRRCDRVCAACDAAWTASARTSAPGRAAPRRWSCKAVCRAKYFVSIQEMHQRLRGELLHLVCRPSPFDAPEAPQLGAEDAVDDVGCSIERHRYVT